MIYSFLRMEKILKQKELLPIVSILIGNLIILYGVLYWGWQIQYLLFLYWLENIAIGYFAVAKMRFRRRHYPKEQCMWPFFLVHYGFFTFIHGVFVIMFNVVELGAGENAPFYSEGLWNVLSLYTLMVLGYLFLSHGFSYVVNFIVKEEYKKLSTDKLFLMPYTRIVIMHLGVLGIGVPLMIVGDGLWAVLVVVAAKTFFDYLSHKIEHKLVNVKFITLKKKNKGSIKLDF
jgi:hypothetical protein